MTTTPKPAGRPNRYEDVVRAARLLADRIRDRRDVDTHPYEMELARLRRALKDADR